MNIILVSHSIHTFIYSEIKWASKTFNRVVVLCPYDEQLDLKCKDFINVEYIVLPERKISYFLPKILKICSSDALHEIISCIKNKKFSMIYLKWVATYLLLARELIETMENLKIVNDNEWILLSLWFSASAYAVCKAKEKHPGVRIASLAHSYEVDSIKTPFLEYLFKAYCHKNLDYISFISKEVMTNYINNFAKPHNWRIDNCGIDYLGLDKPATELNKNIKDNVIRLVSCSHCVKVKRIDYIINALKEIDESYSIIWTHIGGGVEFESLSSEAQSIKKRNIVVNFLGNLDNSKVHSFFLNEPIDVFINVSESEGLPVTLMEAASYGIPLIATDVGGNREIVNDNNGKLISSNPTYSEIADAIIQVGIESKNIPELRISAYNSYAQKFNAADIRPEFYSKIRSLM